MRSPLIVATLGLLLLGMTGLLVGRRFGRARRKD